jgi:hypothetical protein
MDSLIAFKDAAIKPNLEKVTILKTEADILNYMSSLGWSLIQFTGLNNKYFIFKREFEKSELVGH